MKNRVILQESCKPIYLVGPTGVGKSAVALELATQLNAEIIVADSMQVYRGLDIGTAKPSPEEREKIPHHLLDIVDPSEDFDVSKFVKISSKILKEIQTRGKTPLIVGGTGLYIKAMMDGLFSGPGKNLEIRKRLEEEALSKGLESLYDRLSELDPQRAAQIPPHHQRRIIRALEIYETTGKPIGQFQNQWTNPQANVCIIGLNRDRKDLYERINHRVDEMIQQGLVQEAQKLFLKGLRENATVMQAIGYKELMTHFKGLSNIEEAIVLIKQNSRHLAKRQLTWFKKDPRVHWFFLEEESPISKIVQDILKFLTHPPVVDKP